VSEVRISNSDTLVAHFRNLLAERGLIGTLAYLPYALRERYWRWQFGIQRNLVSYSELGYRGGLAHHHVVSHYQDFQKAVQGMEIRPDRDVFLDYGSGIGAVVLMAAMYPFKRVIGVELSQDLSSVAQRLVERNRRRLRCQTIELITADATTYALPDDLNVIFFYSPFHGELLTKVLGNIRASLARAHRRLTIIYAKTDYLLRDVSGLDEWLIRRRSFKLHDGDQCVVFESR
jgi:16S rRNA G966 N2-methylase RsmD